MRNLSIILSVSAFFLVCCTDSEQPSLRQEEPVAEESVPMQFTSYLGRSRDSSPSTKGPGSPQANPLGEGGCFNVKAYYNADATHSQVFYSCVKYTWDDNKYFVSSPVYYWPVNGTVDFYAVSPADADRFLPDSVINVASLDAKTDLIVAKALGKTKESAFTLVFGHKLTKISFKVAGTDSNLEYRITSIKLNACSDAAFHCGDEDTLGFWTGASNPADREFIADSDTVVVSPGSKIEYTDVPQSRMFIPIQQTVSLSVTYTASQNGVMVASATKDVDISSSLSKWGVNKHITYLLNITPDSKPITFEASITDWADGGTHDVNLGE